MSYGLHRAITGRGSRYSSQHLLKVHGIVALAETSSSTSKVHFSFPLCKRCYNLIHNPYMKGNVVSPLWNLEALTWTQLQRGSFGLHFRPRVGNSCTISQPSTTTWRASIKVSGLWVQWRCWHFAQEVPANRTKVVNFECTCATSRCLAEQIRWHAGVMPLSKAGRSHCTMLLLICFPGCCSDNKEHLKSS